jgi:hypothetical protein
MDLGEDVAVEIEELDRALKAFESNVEGVRKLMRLDQDLMDIVIGGLRDLEGRLVRSPVPVPSVLMPLRNSMQHMEKVRENKSLKPRFEIVFNQAVVLLVSYFGTALEELFKMGVKARLDRDDDKTALMREELRLSFREIRDRGWQLKEIAADLLVDKKDLSFQDMKTTGQALRDYCGINMERDRTANNIIVAQACRHVIVHAGNEVTPKMLHQLRDAVPRDLKPNLVAGSLVQFAPEEVEIAASSMQNYVAAVAAQLSGIE